MMITLYHGTGRWEIDPEVYLTAAPLCNCRKLIMLACSDPAGRNTEVLRQLSDWLATQELSDKAELRREEASPNTNRQRCRELKNRLSRWHKFSAYITTMHNRHQ